MCNVREYFLGIRADPRCIPRERKKIGWHRPWGVWKEEWKEKTWDWPCPCFCCIWEALNSVPWRLTETCESARGMGLVGKASCRGLFTGSLGTVTKHLRPVVFERSFNEAKNYCRRCVGVHRQEREEGKRGHGGRQWLGDMVRHPDPNRHQSYYHAFQGMFDVHVRCVHKLLPLPQLSWPWGSGSKQKCRVKSVATM